MTGPMPPAIARGAAAPSPAAYSNRAWRAIASRVWRNSGRRHLGLMSAGVAFYAFLSFVPLLAALVMIYALFADPEAVARHMHFAFEALPRDAARIIADQLATLTEDQTDQKGLGLIVALALSIVSASRAARAMMDALNVIYEQTECRSLIRSTLISAALVVAALVTALVGLAAAGLVGYARGLIGSGGAFFGGTAQVAAWLIAALLCSLLLASVYRFAPDRADARWRWLSLGAAMGTLMWLAATFGFGLYAANFARYEVTYGSLGAVVALLMWLFVSAYAVLLGALINAEAERQTARDTTTGRPLPMGRRGATMADMSSAIGTPSVRQRE
ncbi:YihY/virulence factor BrkB family protein [Sphingopyxis terrae]|nr:YihY/virulence factor BrkB family protein [Sphingopyxis terrae]